MSVQGLGIAVGIAICAIKPTPSGHTANLIPFKGVLEPKTGAIRGKYRRGLLIKTPPLFFV